MAVLLAALGLFIYVNFRSQLDSTIDQGLQSKADDVGGLIAGSDRPGDPGGSVLTGEESFAQVLTRDGRILDSTPRYAGRPLLTRPELRRAGEEPLLVDRENVARVGPARLLATARDAGDRRVVVVVGAELDDRREALNDLRTLMLVGGPVALLLASLAGYAMSVAALRPVEAIRRRAAAISAAEPEARLPVPEARDEIFRLSGTLNEMLARLEVALERERTFVDDASHELRTPLTLHKTELELALRYAQNEGELREAIASAVEEVDRLVQLAEDLLVVARSEKGRLAVDLEPVQLDRLLEDLRERFASRAAEAGRRIRVEAPDGLRVNADRLRLEQALTNVIDNALRHGEGDVRIRAGQRDGVIELHVEDEGPGFPPEFIGHAFERFTRADASRASGGTGLGLAIVETIAAAHRGRARATNLPGGGADVWIELPAQNG